MAHVQPVVTANTETDAEWRAWAQAIHDALAACGLVQTADTGQINLATAARPAGNSDGGYELWRLNDAEQATDPIFVKLVYGSASQPKQRLTIHIGQGSNGIGNITGNVISHTNLPIGTATVGALTEEWFAAGDGSYFFIYFAPNPTSSYDSSAFGVGRLRDEDGNAVAGRHWYAQINAATSTAQTFRAFHSVAGWSADEASNGPAFLSFEKGAHHVDLGGDIALSGAVVLMGAEALYLRELVAYPTAEIALGNVVTAELLGMDHNFKCLLPSSITPREFWTGGVDDTGNGLGILWDD